MKQLTRWMNFKTLLTLLVLSSIQTIAWAQDSTGTTSTRSETVTTETHTDWYSQPWVWVVGGVVLLLILYALLRGNTGTASNATSRTDKVTVTKTTSTDSDV